MDRLESKEAATPSEMPREEAALSRDAYALLAQANLLRMRGHWEEAAQSCMAALRLAPDSSSANSLLGDIYENQGRYDDAAQWYRMALDVNPDSPADLLKLDLLRRREEGQQDQSRSPGFLQPATSSSAAFQDVTPSAPHSGLMQRLRGDPELALRAAVIIAALALVLVVACAYLASRHAGAAGSFGLGREAVVDTKPIVVPPLTGSLPADPDAAPVRDPSEESLLASLQAAPELSALGIAVYDVQSDPRSSHITVTFGRPADPSLTQAQVEREALRVLESAAATGTLPVTYTVRCVLIPSTGTGTALLGFVGDTAPASIQALPASADGVTDAQAAAVFTNLWWSSTANIRG